MKRGEDTKERLMRAALKSFVRKGVAETTTREIAIGAGVAEGTIYRHFESKEELAWILFREHHLGLAQAIDDAQAQAARIEGKVAAVIDAYCRWADEDWLLFSYHLLAMHAHLHRITDEMVTPVGVIRRVIGEAAANSEIDIPDVDLVAAMVMGVVLQPAVHKIYGHVDGSLSVHARTFTEAALRILKS